MKDGCLPLLYLFIMEFAVIQSNFLHNFFSSLPNFPSSLKMDVVHLIWRKAINFPRLLKSPLRKIFHMGSAFIVHVVNSIFDRMKGSSGSCIINMGQHSVVDTFLIQRVWDCLRGIIYITGTLFFTSPLAQFCLFRINYSSTI